MGSLYNENHIFGRLFIKIREENEIVNFLRAS